MESNLKIGISARFHNKAPVFYGESLRHIQYLETSLAQWIAANQALPLMIPSESVGLPLEPQHFDVVGFARELDGLILQGGIDVHPSSYQPDFQGTFSYPCDIVRDRYELSLIRAFIEQRKPILGICRGMQLINVHFGGTLFEDLETHGYGQHLDRERETQFTHDIQISEGGLLSRIYPGNAHVVSVHHQGVRDLGAGLTVEALSANDSLVEAISLADEEHFVLAVQWHPEFHPKEGSGLLDANLLLRAFTSVARNRKFYGSLAFGRRKKISFGKSKSLTLGAELELQIVNPENFDLSPSAPHLLDELKGSNTRIKSEIFKSMIEVETDVCDNVIEIEKDLTESCVDLLRCSQKQGLLIGATGVHPFASYLDREVTEKKRYFVLLDTKQWIARRISIFGLHCHVGVQSPEEGIEIYRFYLSVAPLLLGLSASSPFFQSEQTGLASVRSTFFESTPAGGHPPILSNWVEFEGLMAKMMKSKAITSYKDLWWDIRPSINYGTIEIRVCDMMPTVRENVALVALIHLLGHAYLNFKDIKLWPHLAEWSYRENKWRALRYGLDFDCIVNDEGDTRPARELLTSILEELKPLSEEFGYGTYYDLLLNQMLVKTSAERQLAVFEKTESLEEVVRAYCTEFSAGLS